MSLIDERGRLFGRINIIDAVLVGVVLVLLPIVYTAARLFRVPRPVVERVEPATVPVGTLRIRVHGRQLRPYLKALASPSAEPFVVTDLEFVNQLDNVLLETPAVMEVKLPNLQAGTYDLHVFDMTREIATLPRAFTLVPPSSLAEVQRVRANVVFSVPLALSRLIRVGDLDVSDGPGASGDPLTPLTRATLTTIHVRSERVPSLTWVDTWNAWLTPGETVALVDTTVEVPTLRNSRGVREYLHQPLLVGNVISFRTPLYLMNGTVAAVSDLDDPPSPRSSLDKHGDGR